MSSSPSYVTIKPKRNEDCKRPRKTENAALKFMRKHPALDWQHELIHKWSIVAKNPSTEAYLDIIPLHVRPGIAIREEIVPNWIARRIGWSVEDVRVALEWIDSVLEQYEK